MTETQLRLKSEHPHYEGLYRRYTDAISSPCSACGGGGKLGSAWEGYVCSACHGAGRISNVRRVLEMGVARGESLAVWLDWWPEAEVVGVDSRPGQGDLVEGEKRCRLFQLDQCDQRLLLLGRFDLVIDDAGHDPIRQRRSLEMLWPQLNPGGIYTVEDLETSYWPLAIWNVSKLGGGNVEGWENPLAVIPYLKSLADGLIATYANKNPPTPDVAGFMTGESRFPTLEGLTAIHWHRNIVFLEKE